MPPNRQNESRLPDVPLPACPFCQCPGEGLPCGHVLAAEWSEQRGDGRRLDDFQLQHWFHPAFDDLPEAFADLTCLPELAGRLGARGNPEVPAEALPFADPGDIWMAENVEGAGGGEGGLMVFALKPYDILNELTGGELEEQARDNATARGEQSRRQQAAQGVARLGGPASPLLGSAFLAGRGWAEFKFGRLGVILLPADARVKDLAQRLIDGRPPEGKWGGPGAAATAEDGIRIRAENRTACARALADILRREYPTTDLAFLDDVSQIGNPGRSRARQERKRRRHQGQGGA